MADRHPQAHFDSDEILECSPELEPGALRAALPRGEGLRVSRIEGVGLVAARRIEDFTHVVAGLAGTYPVDLVGWHENPGEQGELDLRPVDLGFLADTPRGAATRLLDAALAGPVTFFEPDATRRTAWMGWLSYALPGGAGLTFSTAGDEDVHVRAAEAPEALDTTEPWDGTPSFYARVALELAARGELQAAAARLEEPDGLALAVHGGATDLIAPHQLPLALQLITELVAAGRVREAARAAAGIPARAGSALAVREAVPLPEVVDPEPEPIPEADVVEPEPRGAEAEVPEPEPEPVPEVEVEVVEPDDIITIRFDPPPPPVVTEPLPEDVVVSVPFEAAPAEPEPAEPDPLDGDVVVSVPFQPAAPEPVEAEDVVAVPFEPAPAEELEPEPVAADESVIGDDEVIQVPFEEPLPDADAWSSLLADLKTGSVAPDESLPALPDVEELRVRERLLPPTPEPPALPEPEPEPDPVEATYELGISLEDFAASLQAAPTPEPDEDVEVIEEEVGMSLAELEESLRREREE